MNADSYRHTGWKTARRPCTLCHEPLGVELSASLAEPMHRACALRSGVGGIGHLLDHEHFCVAGHDPDAGLDFRTSALLVDELVARLGTDRALR
jgi:hypothetical protein